MIKFDSLILCFFFGIFKEYPIRFDTIRYDTSFSKFERITVGGFKKSKIIIKKSTVQLPNLARTKKKPNRVEPKWKEANRIDKFKLKRGKNLAERISILLLWNPLEWFAYSCKKLVQFGRTESSKKLKIFVRLNFSNQIEFQVRVKFWSFTVRILKKSLKSSQLKYKNNRKSAS